MATDVLSMGRGLKYLYCLIDKAVPYGAQRETYCYIAGPVYLGSPAVILKGLFFNNVLYPDVKRAFCVSLNGIA